jgi:16S rRNA C1402 (ribose-2'-O) methylase RsmI
MADQFDELLRVAAAYIRHQKAILDSGGMDNAPRSTLVAMEAALEQLVTAVERARLARVSQRGAPYGSDPGE